MPTYVALRSEGSDGTQPLPIIFNLCFWFSFALRLNEEGQTRPSLGKERGPLPLYPFPRRQNVENVQNIDDWSILLSDKKVPDCAPVANVVIFGAFIIIL